MIPKTYVYLKSMFLAESPLKELTQKPFCHLTKRSLADKSSLDVPEAAHRSEFSKGCKLQKAERS